MKYEMVADLAKGTLQAFGKEIAISCIVRNEVNGWRRGNEVVKSIPEGLPIMPRQFPKGTWNVFTPVVRKDPYLAPYFIPTDAFQFLPIWELDSIGHYKCATKTLTKDTGYGGHTSTSNTTQGCIKILNWGDLVWVVEQINKAFLNKDKVVLTVR